MKKSQKKCYWQGDLSGGGFVMKCEIGKDGDSRAKNYTRSKWYGAEAGVEVRFDYNPESLTPEQRDTAVLVLREMTTDTLKVLGVKEKEEDDDEDGFKRDDVIAVQRDDRSFYGVVLSENAFGYFVRWIDPNSAKLCRAQVGFDEHPAEDQRTRFTGVDGLVHVMIVADQANGMQIPQLLSLISAENREEVLLGIWEDMREREGERAVAVLRAITKPAYLLDTLGKYWFDYPNEISNGFLFDVEPTFRILPPETQIQWYANMAMRSGRSEDRVLRLGLDGLARLGAGEDVYEHIVLEARDDEIRLAALARITTDEARIRIARQSDDWHVCEALFKAMLDKSCVLAFLEELINGAPRVNSNAEFAAVQSLPPAHQVEYCLIRDPALMVRSVIQGSVRMLLLRIALGESGNRALRAASLLDAEPEQLELICGAKDEAVRLQVALQVHQRVLSQAMQRGLPIWLCDRIRETRPL